METELEKWQRWYAGMERAKKMWFRKYREMRQQRDNALAELRCTKQDGKKVGLASRLFAFAFLRHINDHHNADYEVCRDWLCRAAWWLENRLWYGGER